MNRTCALPGCTKAVPIGQRRYCSPSHRETASTRRYRARKDVERKLSLVSEGTAQRGETYDKLAAHKLFDAIDAGIIDQKTAAAMIAVEPSAVSKAYAAWKADVEREVASIDWEMEPDVARMLGLGREVPDFRADPDAFAEYLDWLVAGFKQWRDTYCTTPKGVPYITKEFHLDWIRAILRAMFTGGQQLILSPPRHGKSELMVHFCVWAICRNPQIHILWISASKELAAQMMGAVQEHLTYNERLIADVIAPDQSFAPTSRIGSDWNQRQFTVECRPVRGDKAPTMISLSRGSKDILSRDADVIVVDDFDSQGTVEQPAIREKGRRWFFQDLGSRKEEHTAWVVIGSRQHIDDLNGYLLDDPDWEVIVESAHDQTCGLDPLDFDVHVGCMLFPEMRTYRWLHGKRTGAQVLGMEALFEMIYLNAPRSEGTGGFIKENVEMAFNHSRGIGLDGIPASTHLVGGLDPAAVMYQSSFLWAIDTSPDAPKTHWMVDLDNHTGGGIDAALDLMSQWLDRYGVRHWVIEDQGFQQMYTKDRKITEWAAANDVVIESHETQGTNKWDSRYGISALARLYDPEIGIKADLPYGTVEAREKVNLYLAQMMRFGSDDLTKARRVRGRTDILMASWFPMKVARRLLLNAKSEMMVDFPTSFPTWDIDLTELGAAPW